MGPTCLPEGHLATLSPDPPVEILGHHLRGKTVGAGGVLLILRTKWTS